MIKKLKKTIKGANMMLDDLQEVTIDQIALTNMYFIAALVKVLAMKAR
jgi:hypothetical protein